MPLRESVQNQSERAHYLARTDLFVNIGMIDGIMRFAYLLFTPPDTHTGSDILQREGDLRDFSHITDPRSHFK